MAVRIGGVPEHFNLPWLLAIEERAFEPLELEVEWVDFPGGTGDIMAALDAGEIDLATPLTEGAVVAIAGGNRSRLVRGWVRSPLLWGIHVAGGGTIESLDELDAPRFAVSRIGSGSELMARVLAERHHWPVDDEHLVVVGGLEGALEALPAGEAELFLWNLSMTQPHVDAGTLRRVGVLSTPWPSFMLVSTIELLAEAPGLPRRLGEAAFARATELRSEAGAATIVADRYGLDGDTAATWLDHVEWESDPEPDAAVLAEVVERMVRLGRLDAPVAVSDLTSAPESA